MKIFLHQLLVFSLCLTSTFVFSQEEENKWRALFAIGVNSPSQNGFVEEFRSKSTNFPTINLGIQHFFKPQLGVKVDYGYNRFVNEDNSPEFKINYSRVNAQIVFNASNALTFIPQDLNIIVHAGPGFSMVKPLNLYQDNNIAYFNAMAGLEFHYILSRAVSIVLDGSFIKGFSKDFEPITNGFGSFNGDLVTVTIGASVALSGCRTCN